MAFTKVAPAGIGSTPGDGYRIGDSFLHSTGVDITNINATGIVTAASLDISGAIDFDGHTELDNVNISGVSTFAGNIDANGDLDVDGHTNLDNVSVSGVSTFSGIVAAGVGSTAITLDNNHKMTFGSAHELEMFHDGSNSYIKNRFHGYPARLKIISENNAIDIMSGSGGNAHGGYENAISCEINGATKIYHAGVGPYFETYGAGVMFQGSIQVGQDITHHTDTDTKIRFPLHNTISFETTGNERLRIHQDGQLLVGGVTAARTVLTNYTPRLQIEGIDKSSTSASLTANSNSAVGPSFWFAKTRGTSIGSNTVVQDDDELGTIVFNGADGTDVQSMGAYIRASVDGTPGSNDMPGRLQFHTATGGTMYERLRITSDGKVGINDNNPDSQLVVKPVSGHSTAKVTSGDGNTTMVMQAVQGSEGRLGMTSNHSLAIYSGGLEKLRINTNGNFTFYNSAAAWNTIQRATATHYIGLRIQEGDGTQRMQFGVAGTAGHIITGSAQHDVCLKAYDANLLLATNATERLRITSDGQIGVNNTSPDAWHSTYRSIQIYDGAVLYGSADDSFVGLGANHFLNTSGDFKYSNTDFASRFYQVNGGFHFESAASGTAGNTFSFTERLRITSDGQLLHTANKSSAYTARFVQAHSSNPAWIEINSPSDNNLRPAYIQLQNAGTNKWGIGQVYQSTSSGAFHISTGAHSEATSKFVITSAGKVGINQSDPGGSGLDITTSRTTNFSTTSDQRSLANLVLRQSSDAPNRFVSLSFVNGGGTQAEASINLMQTGNYEGDFRFKFRSGGGSNDWRQRFNFKSNGLLGVNCNPNRSIHVSQEYQGTSGVAAFENNNSNNSSAITFMSTLRDGNSGESFLQCNRDQDNNGQGVKAVFFIRTNGDCDSDTNSYGGISDIKLKENIVDAKSQWDDIKNIKVRNFNFKDNPSQKMLGVVAQEVETVSAGLVKDCPDENLTSPGPEGTSTKSVKYSILYMKAIKALQEAQARIETLEAKVSALEGS